MSDRNPIVSPIRRLQGQLKGRLRRRARPRFAGLSFNRMIPNLLTMLGLCSGLTGMRLSLEGKWEHAVMAIVIAAVFDILDGRVARMLNMASKFGAELDSLSDAVSFGVAPALILFLWCLQSAPRLGWFASLAFAICCVLRLARFNAALDMADQPHKSAGFLTGVPAPLGAALAFLPMYLWIASGNEIFRMPQVVGPWLLVIAFLMISGMATLSWQSARPRRAVRLELLVVLALVFAALISEPWLTLAGICLAYLLLLPVGVVAYGRVRRRRAARADLRQKARAAAGPAPDEP